VPELRGGDTNSSVGVVVGAALLAGGSGGEVFGGEVFGGEVSG
jgi:hypothetical protein